MARARGLLADASLSFVSVLVPVLLLLLPILFRAAFYCRIIAHRLRCPPHFTVLLCRSRSRSLVNDLRHTSQTKGVGLQPLACRCKLGRRVNARPHVAHLCIVADTRRDPTTARCVSGGRLLLVDWHRRKSPDCTSAKWHSNLNHETIWMCFRCAPHCVHHDSTSFLQCALHAGRTALIG